MKNVFPFLTPENRFRLQDKILEWRWGDESGSIRPRKVMIDVIREVLTHPRFPLFEPTATDQLLFQRTQKRIEQMVMRGQCTVDVVNRVSCDRMKDEMDIEIRSLPSNAERVEDASKAELVAISNGLGKLALAWQVHYHPQDIILTNEEARHLGRATTSGLSSS